MDNYIRTLKKTLLILLTLAILSGCEQAISPSTATKEPSLTVVVASSTPRPSRTPYPSRTPIPTATEWIKVYPTKKALVIYGTSWRNEYTINFIEWGDFFLQPYLILYEDGQLIFGVGAYEKQLSQRETEEILTNLEQLGFFQIQDTYAADMQNPLYIFPTEGVPFPNLSSASIVLTVNGEESKSIRYIKELENYLMQPMKDILSYLNSFSMEDATPYQPERLLVAFSDEESKRIPEDATIIPWPEDVTPPSHRSWMGVLYLEGAEALRLYKAAGESLYEYFSFEGKNYNVYLRPILPHECHIYHLYELEKFPEEAQPHFTCDDW